MAVEGSKAVLYARAGSAKAAPEHSKFERIEVFGAPKRPFPNLRLMLEERTGHKSGAGSAPIRKGGRDRPV